MSVMEFLSGGGGEGLPAEIPDPEAPPAGGADPLAALLGGGGAPTQEQPTQNPQEQELAALRDLIGLSRAYLDLPTVTEQERLEVERATTIFQKLLAQNEKQTDSLTGANPALRKAFAGGP